jgi:parvulin-like peptidyl-prolyl isomerase
VLDGEINFTLLQQALKTKQRSVSGEEIDAEVARAAEAYGFMTSDDNPDVQRWLNEIAEREGMEVEVYVRDAVWPSVALKKLVEDQVQVTDEDRQKGFEANYGPRVEVLAIVLSNQRTAQEVWDLARSNLTPKFFGELAAQYSIEPVSRANMGEVPPIRRFSGQPQVEEEAFSLTQKDPLSAIVAVADKYIIMYYLGRTEPIVTKLDDVRDELDKDIHEKKLRLAMSQEFDRLKEVAQIDNFLAGSSQAGGPPKAESASQTQAQPARSSPPLVRPAAQRPSVTR